MRGFGATLRLIFVFGFLALLGYMGEKYLYYAGMVSAVSIVAYGYIQAIRFWRLVGDVMMGTDMLVYSLVFGALALVGVVVYENPWSLLLMVVVYPLVFLKTLYIRLKPYTEEIA